MKTRIAIIFTLVIFIGGVLAYIFTKQKDTPTNSTGVTDTTLTDQPNAQATETVKPDSAIGRLTIKSMDIDNNSQFVPGSTINIRNKITQEDTVVVVGTDGTVEVDLPLGDYEAKEVSPAPGYETNDTTVAFTLAPLEDPSQISTALAEFYPKSIQSTTENTGTDLLPDTNDPDVVILPVASNAPDNSNPTSDIIPKDDISVTSTPITITKKPNNPKTSDKFSLVIATILGGSSVMFLSYLYVLKNKIYR